MDIIGPDREHLLFELASFCRFLDLKPNVVGDYRERE